MTENHMTRKDFLKTMGLAGGAALIASSCGGGAAGSLGELHAEGKLDGFRVAKDSRLFAEAWAGGARFCFVLSYRLQGNSKASEIWKSGSELALAFEALRLKYFVGVDGIGPEVIDSWNKDYTTDLPAAIKKTISAWPKQKLDHIEALLEPIADFNQAAAERRIVSMTKMDPHGRSKFHAGRLIRCAAAGAIAADLKSYTDAIRGYESYKDSLALHDDWTAAALFCDEVEGGFSSDALCAKLCKAYNKMFPGWASDRDHVGAGDIASVSYLKKKCNVA